MAPGEYQRLAAEAKDEENLALGRCFHEQFARIQLDASLLAEQKPAV